MNRPITYGRSLRAAALALADRPQDRPVLKADVAWLIKAEIGGAYTYDDFYNTLKQHGVVPSSSSVHPRRSFQVGTPKADSLLPTEPDDISARVVLAQEFGGGSGDPGLGGGTDPYPPVSPWPPTNIPVPVPVTPVGPRPPSSGGGGGGGRNLISVTGGGTFLHYPTPPMASSGGHVPNGPSPAPHNSLGSGVYRPREIVPVNPTNPDLRIDFPWDNSNSQYGLLGVWAGAEVGIEVPDEYWLDVEKHWLSCQLRTGEWSYHKQGTDGYFAMTCAGVASLLVTHEYLDLPMLKGAVGREPYSPGLTAGIRWLDQGDNGIATPNKSTHYLGYDLFGIERVGQRVQVLRQA